MRDIRQVRTDLQDPKTVVEAYITDQAWSQLNNRWVQLNLGIGIDLATFRRYRDRRRAGQDISADLALRRLSVAAFDVVAGVWEVVSQNPPGQVLTSEWYDLEDILIQHLKEQAFPQWRTEEQQRGFGLTPEYFRLRSSPAAGAAGWQPRPWRSDLVVRRAWVATLRGRVEREQALRASLRAAVDFLEERLLTELRDELMRTALLPNLFSQQRRDALAQRLQIDLQESPCRMTTRVAQAIETLQGILFGARNGLLEDPGFALVAPDFDREWRWIGSYASWLAAMQVFLYPENALRPRLRRRTSPAFAEFLKRLDDVGPQISADQVATEVCHYESYFRDVCSLRHEAVTRMAGSLAVAGDCAPLAGTGGTRYFIVARAAHSGKFYYSLDDREPGWWHLGGPNQTYWREIPKLDQADQLTGLVLFRPAAGTVSAGFYASANRDGVVHSYFAQFDGNSVIGPVDATMPVLVCSAQYGDGVVPGGTGQGIPVQSSWRLRTDDRLVPLDWDGDGRREIVVLRSAREADGSLAIAVLREESAGLVVDRMDALPRGWDLPPGAPIVLRTTLKQTRQGREDDRVERLLVIFTGIGQEQVGLLGQAANGSLALVWNSVGGSIGERNNGPARWNVRFSRRQIPNLPGDTNPPVFVDFGGFTAGDIDGDGRSELLAIEHTTDPGGPGRPLMHTRTTTTLFVIDALDNGLALRSSHMLNFDIWSVPAGSISTTDFSEEEWQPFVPVRDFTGTAFLIMGKRRYFPPGGGEVLPSESWAGVLRWNRVARDFDQIVPRRTFGMFGTPSQWTVNHLADRLIPLDLDRARAGQEILLIRAGSSELAILALQAGGSFVMTWYSAQPVPAGNSSAQPWTHDPQDTILAADVDGDGAWELVVIAPNGQINIVGGVATGLATRWSIQARVPYPGSDTGGWVWTSATRYRAADIDGDGLTEILAVSDVPSSAARLGVIRGVQRTTPGLLNGIPKEYGPRGLNPLPIEPWRSAVQIAARRKDMAIAYPNNPNLPNHPWYAYLDEAYFFIPLEAAIRLRQAGDYGAALDWLRSIYDYGAPPADRVIAYKLILDAGASPLSRPADWLRDPLDPHALAAARKNSYTRFTVLAIVRCLLDYADAEFTRATPESVPRARELYLEALELLGLDILRREPDACDGLIGSLTITIGEPDYRWVWNQIRDVLGKLPQLPLLRSAVARLRPILNADEPLHDRLAQAEDALRATLRLVEPSPTYEELLTNVAVRRERAELALLANAEPFRVLERLGSPFHHIEPVDPGDGAFDYIPAPAIEFCVPPNPVLEVARAYAELNLAKLRSCRNIAGLELHLAPYALPTAAQASLTTLGEDDSLPDERPQPLQPLPYRYATLIERAKELVQLAQQIESSMLNALQNRDQATYQLLRARQDLELAKASVRLKDLQVTEATDGVTLADLQRQRAEIQRDEYDRLLRQDITTLEYAELALLGSAAVFQGVSATSSFAAAAQAGWSIEAFFSTWSKATAELAQGFSSLAAAASTTATIVRTLASYERRRQDWAQARALSAQDMRIGAQQIVIAQDQVRIAAQDRAIAALQVSHDETMVEFIETKVFGTSALYDWMSGVLQQVYRFFLQQATVMARLAEQQLEFERQQRSPAYIKADYWEPPSRPVPTAPGQPTDVRGLTGSARLLRDIVELDQYAFRTNQRKLQLGETVSLAQLDPFTFQQFRETGVLPFTTPMELFDRRFPGHYLRLVRRVRLTVVALIPPSYGIRATLSSAGVSRVVIGGPPFQTVMIQRGPESVALTAPFNATGLFDLDPQPEVLVPFEGIGVDATWEFRMPRAANPFDYQTIADVLLNIEYTALDSYAYRQQVTRQLDPVLVADRSYSFRNDFPDTWYDLNHPELVEAPQQPMVVTFTTELSDFPANLGSGTLRIRNVLLYFGHDPAQPFTPVNLRYLHFQNDNNQATARSDNGGVISERRGNAPQAWGNWQSPVGTWELALENTAALKKRFNDGEITDILLVITYEGELAAWPS